MDDNFQKSIIEITEEEQRLDRYAKCIQLMEKSLYTIVTTPAAAF